MTDLEPESNTSRRDLLKKAAVAGAVGWTVPMIVTRPAFAQGSIGTDKCECIAANGSVTRSGGVSQLTYRYNPGACNSPLSSGRCVSLATGQVGALGCTGTSVGFATVKIRAFRSTGGFSSTCPIDGAERSISVGGAAAVTGGVLVNSGQQFIISGPLNPNTTVVVYNKDTNAEIQRVCYHFSCSQPLCVNDKHGPFTVIDYIVSDPCTK